MASEGNPSGTSVEDLVSRFAKLEMTPKQLQPTTTQDWLIPRTNDPDRFPQQAQKNAEVSHLGDQRAACNTRAPIYPERIADYQKPTPKTEKERENLTLEVLRLVLKREY